MAHEIQNWTFWGTNNFEVGTDRQAGSSRRGSRVFYSRNPFGKEPASCHRKVKVSSLNTQAYEETNIQANIIEKAHKHNIFDKGLR